MAGSRLTKIAPLIVPQEPSYLLYDNFDRADSDDIGNALTGQTWVSNGSMLIKNNGITSKPYFWGEQTGRIIAPISIAYPYYIYFKYKTNNGLSLKKRIIYRYKDANNYCFSCLTYDYRNNKSGFGGSSGTRIDGVETFYSYTGPVLEIAEFTDYPEVRIHVQQSTSTIYIADKYIYTPSIGTTLNTYANVGVSLAGDSDILDYIRVEAA